MLSDLQDFIFFHFCYENLIIKVSKSAVATALSYKEAALRELDYHTFHANNDFNGQNISYSVQSSS